MSERKLMHLSDIGGEFGFIDRVRETYAGSPGDGLVVPLGDDAAVLETPAGLQTVVTTDMLVEGVHFRRDWSDPYSIGWKAAAVNLSDLAAMGSDPTFAFLSIAFPALEPVEGLDRMYDGFSDCLNRYGARLAGGDTNAAPNTLVLSVTQLGTVPAGQALTRTGARPGDILLVTGALGNSAAGLALLSEQGVVRAEKAGKELLLAHRRPQPRVVAALAARETGKVHAAMDLSDGLIGDLQKLCAASGVGARVDAGALPISGDLRAAAELLGSDVAALALRGGEDYELLLAVAPADVEIVVRAVRETGIAVTPIGEILKAGFRIVAANGRDEISPEQAGWDHFVP